jgi:uncharacterized protein (TIGR02466 family)
MENIILEDNSIEIPAKYLWGTPIWEIDSVFDIEFNNILLNEIYEWRKHHTPWTGSKSPNHWDPNSINMNVFQEKTLEIVNSAISPLFGEHWGDIQINYARGWLHLVKPGDYTPPHSHDAFTFAFVYYFYAPENCGDLLLMDPRRGSDVASSRGDITKWVKIKPKTRKLVIFPGNILHLVEPNKSNETRMSFACTVTLNNPSLIPK